MNFEFLNHLEEFRRRLIICLGTLTLTTIVCFFFSHQILDFLTLPLRKHPDVSLYFQTPYEAFMVNVKAALTAGILFAMPVWMTQLWNFVAPGLYEKERRAIIPLIFFSLALFFAGCAFAYYLVVPAGLDFLLAFSSQTLKPMLTVGPYVSFFLGMILACGALFDFPILMIGLVKLGVVSTQAMVQARKVVLVGIFVVAAVVTPSPDPFSQLLLAIPLWIFFEASLVVCRRFEKPSPSVPQ
ncbi:MAG: twin-arginine translocase subunit TatC [Phycisphaerales bacterium]|nr:twin-arginine translocase subunit TatC [Phycisphaerales bacterium]